VRQVQLAASEPARILEEIRSQLAAVSEVPSVRAFDAPLCPAYLAGSLCTNAMRFVASSGLSACA
jgi:hypothetical protein